MWPHRARRGPANKIDARIFRHSAGSSFVDWMVLAWISSVFRSVQFTFTPIDPISSTSVSTSRIRGTFVSVTGCSVSSAAQMIGSAAFLFPDG